MPSRIRYTRKPATGSSTTQRQVTCTTPSAQTAARSCHVTGTLASTGQPMSSIRYFARPGSWRGLVSTGSITSLGVTAVDQWATDEPGCNGSGACMRTRSPFMPPVSGTWAAMYETAVPVQRRAGSDVAAAARWPSVMSVQAAGTARARSRRAMNMSSWSRKRTPLGRST